MSIWSPSRSPVECRRLPPCGGSIPRRRTWLRTRPAKSSRANHIRSRRGRFRRTHSPRCGGRHPSSSSLFSASSGCFAANEKCGLHDASRGGSDYCRGNIAKSRTCVNAGLKVGDMVIFGELDTECHSAGEFLLTGSTVESCQLRSKGWRSRWRWCEPVL